LTEQTARKSRQTLSRESTARLRTGLATCHSTRGLTPEARAAIVMVCAEARRDEWSPETLLVAVKDACFSAPEIAHMMTTSERDGLLARVITACIQEFFRISRAD
jgi:hypothetical protein